MGQHLSELLQHDLTMNKQPRKRVLLEPELEVIAGRLSPFDRLALAAKLERWVRQLRVSSQALQARPARRSARRLRVDWKVARLN